MKIAGMIALSRFPMWKQTGEQLKKLCDTIVVRFDSRHGDPAILQELDSFFGAKLLRCQIEPGGWSCPEWREQCLRLLDDADVDIVLCPDEDEIFADDIMDDLKAFYYSDKGGMMFEYEPMVTSDGRPSKVYPDKPHMKAFKYKKGLTYYPYHGDAKISEYFNSLWTAKTKIKHYCSYTPQMEAAKSLRTQHKPVTLLGFGPSSKNKFETAGEIWSLNNCIDALRPECLRLTTRVFEMHPLPKREHERTVAGLNHLSILDQLGAQGRRIILQSPDHRIRNSEGYPIERIVQKLGLDWFMGTPCYMVAMAIAEGFTEIRVVGLDQMDYEHTLQRECFGAWMAYAVGRGITISGHLTFLKRFEVNGRMRRYGYDWGPELDEWCYEKMWEGHPLSIKYKIPSRVVDGKLYDGKR